MTINVPQLFSDGFALLLAVGGLLVLVVTVREARGAGMLKDPAYRTNLLIAGALLIASLARFAGWL